MPAFKEITVIGQGLAGSLASFELSQRGLPFRVIDSADPGAASRLAAGLMSPVSGQRTALIWQAPLLLAQAEQSYAALEERLGRRFYHPLPLLRIYTDEEQRRRFRARAEEAAFQDWLGPELEPEALELRGLKAPLGARLLLHTGWLDCAGLVLAWREELKKLGVLEERAWEAQELDSSPSIACLGLQEQNLKLFPKLRFQPTKGELLELEAPSANPDSAYYASHFAIPLGLGRWKLGATYDRQDLDPEPTQAGLALLQAGASSLFRQEPKILKQQAGLRPNLLGHFPVLGSLPEGPNLYIMNGFGSKGALWGPACAKFLIDHLQHGHAIPSELDVNRFN
jgi:glycine/D-amino acid oxidase-like deaminating enzyme